MVNFALLIYATATLVATMILLSDILRILQFT